MRGSGARACRSRRALRAARGARRGTSGSRRRTRRAGSSRRGAGRAGRRCRPTASGSRLADPRHVIRIVPGSTGRSPSSYGVERHAPAHLHRAVEAQQLVGQVRVERRVRLQELELRAVAEQRERAVADQVHRRLVAGDVEQHDLLHELFGAQPVAFVLGGDQRGEEVVGRDAHASTRWSRSRRR